MVGGNSARRRSAPDRLRATLASRLHNTVHTRGFSAGSTYRERRVGARLAPGGGLLRRGDQVMNASRSEGEHTPQTWSRGSSLFCFTLLEGAPPHGRRGSRCEELSSQTVTCLGTRKNCAWLSATADPAAAMPSLANGLAAERRRKNAKHAKRLEKKLGVKVAPRGRPPRAAAERRVAVELRRAGEADDRGVARHARRGAEAGANGRVFIVRIAAKKSG